MDVPEDDAAMRELKERMDRYEQGNILSKSALRLTGRALNSEELESLRRYNLGAEGRIAEDAINAVKECDEIWPLLVQKDIPEDLTTRELDAIAAALQGEAADASTTETAVDASLMLTDPDHLAILVQIIPGDFSQEDVTAYRYATLMAPGLRDPEPFIVAVAGNDTGDHTVVATMLVAATFLRYEQEFGTIPATAAEQLDEIVREDFLGILRTRKLLLES